MSTYGYVRVSTKAQNEGRQMVTMSEFKVANPKPNYKPIQILKKEPLYAFMAEVQMVQNH